MKFEFVYDDTNIEMLIKSYENEWLDVDMYVRDQNSVSYAFEKGFDFGTRMADQVGVEKAWAIENEGDILIWFSDNPFETEEEFLERAGWIENDGQWDPKVGWENVKK